VAERGETTTEKIIEQDLALHRAGRLAEAEATYRAVVAQDPVHGGALLQLGVLALQQGRRADALAWLFRATTVNAQEPVGYLVLGETLRSAGRLDDALSNFNQALALDPGLALAHNGKGAVLQAQGRLDAAIANDVGGDCPLRAGGRARPRRRRSASRPG
jgi:tetratricopeptide (TPR) repeat protein